MADLMTFQDTVEEFMEQYKITDKEQIYTNGADLVPVFRMKQWFEHADFVPVVRCKECKHRDAETGFCKGRGWPMQLVPDGGFCDKGERSEE